MKTRLVQQTGNCSDFDVILAGDNSPAFRIVFPEHIQGEGTRRHSGTHQIPGTWHIQDNITSGIFKVADVFEISVIIEAGDSEIYAGLKVRNLTGNYLKDVFSEVCVSPNHLPGNPGWCNRIILPESPLDRDLQGQEWYGKIAPKNLRALTSGGWILMHPDPDDPDPAKVPQYSFDPSDRAEACACAVLAPDGKTFLYQAWNTECLHVTPSRGNACMHLLPLISKNLPAGESAGVKSLIGIHKGSWESLTDKITAFRKESLRT